MTDVENQSPKAGQIWSSPRHRMPSRRIVDAGNDPLSGVPIVRYVRGQNERGYRTCSLMAWSAWVSDNQAKLTGFRAEFPSSGLDTEERKTGKGGK